MNGIRSPLIGVLLSLFLTGPSVFAAGESLKCTALLRDPSRSVSENLFVRKLTQIRSTFSSVKKRVPEQDPEAFVDAIMKEDFRALFFHLQALGRIYKDRNEKVIERLWVESKAMEDAIGAVDLLKSVTKESQRCNLPEVTAKIAPDLQSAKRKLRAVFEDLKWMNDDRAFANLLDSLSQISWKSDQKENEYFRSEFHSYVIGLRKKIKNDAFSDPDIEKGLHELRRRIRWILIYAQAGDGLVTDRGPHEDLLRKNLHYLQSVDMGAFHLSTPWVKNPISIPRVIFATVRHFVVEIGTEKEKSEIQIQLQKYGANLSNEILVDPESLAQKYQKQIREDGVLKALEKIFESQ